MYILLVLLATIIGIATTGPATYPGLKERIFNVHTYGQEYAPSIKERLFRTATSEIKDTPGLKERLLSSDLATRNSIIEDLIWGLLDDLRELMVNGSDDVPVLDPFELEELNLDLEELADLHNSHVNLKDLTVHYLSTFEVDQLSVSLVNVILQRYRLTLDGRIPVIDVLIDNYDMSVNVFGGNVFGNGQIQAKVINPRVHGYVVVGLRVSISGLFLTVQDCRLHFTLDGFEPVITGMFGNEVASEFVSSFLGSLIPEFVEFFQDDISDILSTTVQDIANDILRDLDLGSILS